MNYTYSKGILEQEGCRPNQRMLISTRKGKTEEKKIGKKIKGGEKNETYWVKCYHLLLGFMDTLVFIILLYNLFNIVFMINR